MYTSVLSLLLGEVFKLALHIPQSHVHTEVFAYLFFTLSPSLLKALPQHFVT